MAYRGGGVPQRRVILDDGPSLDAFNRLRVSQPETLFESQLQYGVAPLFWESALTGSGSATHLPNESSVRLRTTTTTGASWASFDTTNSGVVYDVSASALTGGVAIDAGYVATSATTRSAAINPIESNLVMAQNIAGNSGDILTVAAIRIGNTSSDCGAVIQWKELY